MTLRDLLVKRGIYDQAVTAGWTEQADNNRAGWLIPIFNIAGGRYPGGKWKAADGQHPKCRWPQGQPDRAKYYFLPGTISEIANRGGTAYLASGEPDVLAFRAGGFPHSFCWLNGEGSIPPTLVSDLTAMGVGRLNYYPDRDQAGLISASKLQAVLEPTGIDLCLWQLPGDVGSKNDINKLWMDCGFDREKFQVALVDCLPLDGVDMHLYSSASKAGRTAQQVDDDVRGWRQAWVQEIVKALGTPDTTEGGKARWRCPLPGHDDQTPSFRLAEERTPGFPWPMCSCGIQDDKNAWDRVADAKGVDSWETYKTTRAAERGYTQHAPRPRSGNLLVPGAFQLPQSTPKWVDSHEVLRSLSDEIRGLKPVLSLPPVLFPYKTIRQFGGGARFLTPGKITGIVGITGGGKTTFAMSLATMLIQDGFDVLWWGPEWSPSEYMENAIQRAGGLAVDQLEFLRVWRSMEQASAAYRAKVAIDDTLTRPTEGELTRTVTVIDDLLKTQGRIYFFPNMRQPIDRTLADMHECLTVKRAEGRIIPVLVIDYIQLATQQGRRDWAFYDLMVNKVKTECSHGLGNIHGIITSQSKKDDVAAAWRGAGKVDIGSSQGVAANPFNLYLTLTPEITTEGKVTDVTEVGIVKNSRGRLGSVRLFTDMARGAILDKIASVETIRLTNSDSGYGYTVERDRAAEVYRGGDQ